MAILKLEKKLLDNSSKTLLYIWKQRNAKKLTFGQRPALGIE